MNHNEDIHNILQSIVEKGFRILARSPGQTISHPAFLENPYDHALNSQRFWKEMSQQQNAFEEQFTQYWQDVVQLIESEFKHWVDGKKMPIQDKRFNHEHWVNHPFYNSLSQHYLLIYQHIHIFIQRIDSKDRKLIEKIRFGMQQYMDALSPANFLYTNPQIMTKTISSQGMNLLQGLERLLIDLDLNTAQLKLTHTEAFTVGKNIAITPGKIIFRNDLMELIQYEPKTQKVKEIPLLIIPPWINKYYILDLSPENSFVRWLVEKGITVFMISWVNPGTHHANKGLFDYMQEGPLAAIEVIKKQLQIKKINVLGFCIGGTLLAMLLAYCRKTGNSSIHSATFLATLINFKNPGDIGVFIDEQQIKRIETHMEEKGYLEAHWMTYTFNCLRARDLIWSAFIHQYLLGKAPEAFDILYWNADATNMPYTMHSQYLRWLYLKNHLIKPNKITLNHIPLDLNDVDVPSFFVATQKDHIAPWESVWSGFNLLKGKKQFLLGESGHIAGIINPPSRKKYGYFYNKSAVTAQDWLTCADHHPGSWWPLWLRWLKKHAGRFIEVPVQCEHPYLPLMDAPGSYVLRKATDGQ